MLYRENGQLKTSYFADRQIFPVLQDRKLFVLVLVVAYLLLPLLSSEYMLRAVLVPYLIMVIAALGVNVLVGYCGQITLGSGAFMAVGAYGAYNFFVRVPDMPFTVALLLGATSAMVFGVFFGLPSLRVRGLYLAVATLAAQFFSDWAFLRVGWFTNHSLSGSVQVANLTVFGVPILSAVSKYYFCLVVVCVVALMCKNLVRGAVGREWMAVRDMDVAAEVIGIRPVFAKLSAFAVSSFVVGLAGAMWAFVYLGAWEPSAFSIDQSLRLLFMVIIGGLGTIMGNFLGAAFIVLLPLVLTHAAGLVASLFGVANSTEVIAHVETVVFGGLIVFFLAVEPHGLARLLSMAREKLRIWPYPH